MFESNIQVHGEVTDPKIDIFDRERVFIDTVLKPLIQKFPKLKVVMEHVTTMDAIKFVESCEEGTISRTSSLVLPFLYLTLQVSISSHLLIMHQFGLCFIFKWYIKKYSLKRTG